MFKLDVEINSVIWERKEKKKHTISIDWGDDPFFIYLKTKKGLKLEIKPFTWPLVNSFKELL